MSDAKRDQNSVPSLLAVSSVDGVSIIPLWADPVTHRLLVDLPSGSGTVTSVSVVTANGISGSVATATTTPAITLILGAITPSAIQVSDLTASQILATDASKNLVSLAVATYPSLTELTYLKGVTSAIQTQLGLKAPLASPTFTGTVTIPTGASISGFAPLASPTFTGTVTIPTGASITAPTGLVKGDVGLGNVDNTSNATERAATATLTNKRKNPRFTTATNHTTSTTIDSDANDQYIITAQAGALLFNNPTGTPVDGQTLIIAVTGTAARALTWGTAFEASTVALPTTTVTTARLNMGFIWRADTSKWVIVASV